MEKKVVHYKHFLELQKYILENKDWESQLKADPYFLNIKRDERSHSILFSYNQILSDMSLQICREARGVILNDESFYVKAIGFNKFFNAREKYACEIDWNSAIITDKLDGSIIKIYYDPLTKAVPIHPNTFGFEAEKEGYYYPISIATNGLSNAFEANLSLPSTKYESFGHLVTDIINEKMGKLSCPRDVILLDPTSTYIFELTGPYNRIIVPYSQNDLNLVGIRSNIDGKEENVFRNKETSLLFSTFQPPRTYSFNIKAPGNTSAEQACLDHLFCVTTTQSDPLNEQADVKEGFVVVDKYFNRLKIKSEKYLLFHRTKGECTPTPSRIVDMIKSDSVDDFLGIFPEYEELFKPWVKAYRNLFARLKLLSDIYVDNEGWRELSAKDYTWTIADRIFEYCPTWAFELRKYKYEYVMLHDYEIIKGFVHRLREKPLMALLEKVKEM